MKTQAKKVVEQVKAKKPMTAKRKAELKAKREANPQFSHLVSAARKKELASFKMDAKANLIEAKRQSELFVLASLNKYENEARLTECKRLINKVCKDKDLLSLSIQAVRRNKNGTFSPFYFAQLVQKVVLIVNTKKGHNYKTALNSIIANKKA